MTDDIEIIFSAHDLFQVDIGIEDGFAGEIRAGQQLAMRTDDNAAAAHKDDIRLISKSAFEVGRKCAAGNVMACGKHVTSSFKRDMLRSEEHTSELQSLMRISYAVFCLKKKNE